MSDQEQQILSALELQTMKVLTKDANKVRDEVQSGKGQPVDFTVHVKGHVDVGEDTTVRKSNKPDATQSLGLVFEILHREGLWNELRDRMQDTNRPMRVDEIGSWISSKVGDQFVESFNENNSMPVVEVEHNLRAKDLVSRTTTRSTSPRKGSISGSLEITTLDLTKVATRTVDKMTRKIKV